MEKSLETQNILFRIKKLDYQAGLVLMENLAKHLRRTKKEIGFSTSSHQLTELSGMGSDIWENIDIDQYIRKERQWD